MDDDLKPHLSRTAVSVNELTDEEQSTITTRVFRQINFLTPNPIDRYSYKKTTESKQAKGTIDNEKTARGLPSSSTDASSVVFSHLSRQYSTANSISTIDSINTQLSVISTIPGQLGIGRITTKLDKSYPKRKTPAEVYHDSSPEVQFFLALYEIFIHHSALQKKPPRSMIPYKVRAPGELPHPSVNNTLRFEINSRHYNLMLGGEEKGLGLSRILHLDSFLIKCYDYSGRIIFSIFRPLTWNIFFFGAVFFGNDVEVRNIEDKVIGRIRQVRDCNITLHIYNTFEERIMCVRSNISVSRCGFVDLKNCVMKFYDWDDELLYATLVFEGTYSKKRFWNYKRCVESVSMLKFDVEVHPIWKMCILSTYFFLFRNYLEERRPIFMGAGITLMILLCVIILLICLTIGFLRGLYYE